MAYSDADLKSGIQNISYDPNKTNSWTEGAVNYIDNYLDAATPDELLQRYQYIKEQNPSNLDDWLKKNYGVSNSKDKAYYAAYTNFKNQVGRDPNANEFAQIAPVFYNPSDFGSGVSAGRQALATYAEQEKNKPENLVSKAGQYSGDVGQIFQSLLGRGATDQELQHFGSMLATKQLDPYTLSQFVQQLPEYQDIRTNKLVADQEAKDIASRSQLASELGQYDQNAFSKYKEDVISRYAQMGTQNSPALDFALTNLMGDIQKQRGAYMADVARQDYQNQRALKTGQALQATTYGRQDYENALNNYLGQRGYSQQRSDAMIDALNQRAWAGQDYYTQQRDYENYLRNNKPQQMNPWTQAGLALIPAAGQAAGSYYGSK